MFIYNVKINGSKIFKYFFTGVIILIICILCIVLFRIFSGAGNANDSSCLPQNDVFEISSKNYTNVLKTVHDDIDTYVGMKIKFTGYVYRVSDLTDNQFVLARDMIISSDYQSVIVGFLCECDNAKDFDDEVTLADYIDFNRGKVAIKLRTILQYVGTNIFRNCINRDIFVNVTINNAISIKNNYGYC